MIRRITTRQYEGETGFGKNITSTGRLMHANGRFNVEREYVRIWDNTYFHLMTMSWGQFLATVFFAFMVMNVLFALVYCALGVEQLNGIRPGTWIENFSSAFFFSSQTLTTVGYGHVSPATVTASLVASLESFAGLLTFALISGLLYGRFSRPSAKVVFSDQMVIAPYRDGRGLMFRMINSRRSELIETEAQLIATLNERNEAGVLERKYFALPLEVSKISFFSLSWTVVHALDDKSPLVGFSYQDMLDSSLEVMVLVKGIEEANHQMVFARRSYVAEEIVWGAKFKPIIGRSRRGVPHVFTRSIGDYEAVDV